MTVGFSAAKALDDYLALIEEPREPDGMYHPSSMHFCLRKTLYEVRAEEQTNPADAESKRRFKIGHMIHELVQASISFSSDVRAFYAEFAVSVPELRVKGHGDGLIEFEDDTYWILEVKSIRATGFKFVRTAPKSEHKKQAGTYAAVARTRGVYVNDDTAGGQAFTNTTDPRIDLPANGDLSTERFIPALGDKLRGILFVYLDKEDINIIEHFVEYDPAWERDLQKMVDTAEEYRVDPESLPARLPREKGKLPWQCNPKWCPWFDRCMGDQDEVRPSLVEIEHW